MVCNSSHEWCTIRLRWWAHVRYKVGCAHTLRHSDWTQTVTQCRQSVNTVWGISATGRPCSLYTVASLCHHWLIMNLMNAAKVPTAGGWRDILFTWSEERFFHIKMLCRTHLMKLESHFLSKLSAIETASLMTFKSWNWLKLDWHGNGNSSGKKELR